jgi:hypothetical protein
MGPICYKTAHILICITRLSVGALYSPLDHSAVKSNPSDFFAARAKAYLDVELDSPSIATLQAVLVLSAYEAANGRDSRGKDTPYPLQYLSTEG